MQAKHGGAARARSTRRGMSLLEVLVSIAVLVIGLAGFLQSLLTTSSLEADTQDQAAASAAARATLERLRATPFAQVFARHNATAADDPGGVVSPGNLFDVPGLRPLPGQAFAGEILFPVDSDSPAMLREDLLDAQLGTPLDLDADGVVDSDDHAGDYRLLPVLVRVSWESARGPASFELRTILGNLQ